MTPHTTTGEKKMAGYRQVRFCQKCGEPVAPGRHYCPKCNVESSLAAFRAGYLSSKDYCSVYSASYPLEHGGERCPAYEYNNDRG